MDAHRAQLAIRAVRVSYVDAERVLLHQNTGDLPRVQVRALELLDQVAMEIEPEVDAELLRLLSETRRRIVQQT